MKGINFVSFVELHILCLGFKYSSGLESRVGFHQPSDCVLGDNRKSLVEVMV